MSSPNIYHINHLTYPSNMAMYKTKDGKVGFARPLRVFSVRRTLRSLWMVIRGKADLVVWDND